MKFRILVLQDPHAQARGFSIKGIKVPLRDWCPILHHEDVATFDGKKLPKGRYPRFWRLHVEDLVHVRPQLERHLKGVQYLLVPTEQCDVAPIERWDEAWGEAWKG